MSTYSPRTAVYPGTFDPMTNGHTDLVHRAAPLFETLYVAIAESPGKGPTFPLAERIALAHEAIGPVANVKIV